MISRRARTPITFFVGPIYRSSKWW